MSFESGTTGRRYVLWYGRSCQPEFNGIPASPSYETFNNEAEITAAVGDQLITHMAVSNGAIPAFDVISPQLTHLEIKGIDSSSELHRLCSLTQLRVLDLSDNDFHQGLPEVICQLTSLTSVVLSRCKLVELPPHFANLTQLNTLNLGFNQFAEIPSAVYRLSSLHELDLSLCNRLERIDDRIIGLTDLTEFDCQGCESLRHPPYAVCELGLSAVRNYFKSVSDTGALTQFPVALIGRALSGKTSLVKSLQQRKRVLTLRDQTSTLDETTRVFQIQSLKTDRLRVKVVDYGGHEVYHMAHTLAQKSSCVPVIVVNAKEFVDLSEWWGVREATRMVLIDRMSHLCLACPRLDSPLLVFTHMDQLRLPASKFRSDLLQTAQCIRERLLEEERLLECEGDRHLQNIDYFSNMDAPLFSPRDIFEFSNDLEESSNINQLTERIEERCQQFTVTVPELWNAVEEYIDSHGGVFISLSHLNDRFDGGDLLVVLRYMHNSGKIFWFEDINELSGYVFHRVHAIANLVSLLFHHSPERQWERLVSNFTPFTHKGRTISPLQYRGLIDQFTETGVLDEALFVHLFRGSGFPAELAMNLLKSFYMIHGPLEQQHQTVYVMPSLSETVLGDGWKTDDELLLRLELVFEGLGPPRYINHLLTVETLSSAVVPHANFFVQHNGATIRDSELALHIVHDFNTHTSALQVSTSPRLIGKGWKVLLKMIAHLYNKLNGLWHICHVEVVSYCAHCLFLQHLNPSDMVDPFFLSINRAIDLEKVQQWSGWGLVACQRCTSIDGVLKCQVPRPLVFPCYHLTDDEVKKLENYFVKLEQSRSQSPAGYPEESEDVAVASAADSGSDVSDIEDTESDDFIEPAVIGMRVRRVEENRILSLYRDTTMVYQMSDCYRGRALIINNRAFSYAPERLGSEIDYRNYRRLFGDLKFDVAKSEEELTNLNYEQIVKEIKEETQRREHEHYGMFVLVVMSHGREGNILDCECEPLSPFTLEDLLSPRKFPAMRGKPKLVIIQTSFGERPDLQIARRAIGQFPSSSRQQSTSSAGNDSSLPPAKVPAILLHSPVADFPPAQVFVSPAMSLRSQLTGSQVFDTKDFFVMAATDEPYGAEMATHGSLFTRMLVTTYYRHACHRDVRKLFNIIKKRVRKASKRCNTSDSSNLGRHTVPASYCTFTNSRKLYLFPKVRPRPP